MQLCSNITIVRTGSALLIAIDNINMVCEIGLYSQPLTHNHNSINMNYYNKYQRHRPFLTVICTVICLWLLINTCHNNYVRLMKLLGTSRMLV